MLITIVQLYLLDALLIHNLLFTEGIWQGEILKVRRGNNGFGYDPIFMDYKTDQSAAELSPELKNRISHRGQALQKLKQKLKILYEEK